MINNKNSNILSEKRKKGKKNMKPFDSISFTTGDIGLNISHFNKMMGTSEDNSSAAADNNNNSESCGLTEAKRYVRRYYIRPQNIFCSNKAEIIKALIEIGNANCSVYTLNNLGDEKDVSKLMNNDIIYYYDDGILYDKNKVKVMDYDLSIKKEENRKHLTNVTKTPNKEFKDVYADRMTTATELEESFIDIFKNCEYDVISADFTEKGDQFVISLNNNIEDIETAASEFSLYLSEVGIYTTDWNTNGSNVIVFNVMTEEELDANNAFDLDFEDYNVFGERLTEAKESFCCVCGEPLEGYGNNPEPYMSNDSGRCCDGCNLKFVIPARLEQIKED